MEAEIEEKWTREPTDNHEQNRLNWKMVWETKKSVQLQRDRRSNPNETFGKYRDVTM